jgi:hypothetical protein
VVPVHRLVEQLRSYVLQRCNHNRKKHNLFNFFNYIDYVNYNHFLKV